MTDNYWLNFHKYNHLVRQEYAEPLTCPDDSGILTLRPKWEEGQIDDMPRLYCYLCGRTIVPGSDVLDQVKEVVERYYAE